MKFAAVDYSTFISLSASKSLLIQYVEFPTSYEIFGIENGAICWQTAISKDGGADQIDFETNYKPTANAPLMGQKSGVYSLPITIAPDQSPIFTSSASLTNISSVATNVTLLSSNTGRKMATVHNDSTANLYIKFGVTASTSSFTVKLISQAYYEFPKPIYTGQIDGIWDAANGNARITEFS